jgi:hypothetical protein
MLIEMDAAVLFSHSLLKQLYDADIVRVICLGVLKKGAGRKSVTRNALHSLLSRLLPGKITFLHFMHSMSSVPM